MIQENVTKVTTEPTMLIDPEWLRATLVAGFGAELAHPNVGSCMQHLNSNDIFFRHEFEELLGDQSVRAELLDIYALNVKRYPVVLDPVAMCCWGPRLLRSRNRVLMGRHLRDWITAHPESQENLARVLKASAPPEVAAQVEVAQVEKPATVTRGNRARVKGRRAA